MSTSSRLLSARWALALGVAFCAAYTGLIALLGDRLLSVPHLPDQGASWYFWKLPAPTLASRLSAWGLYAAHQLGAWACIWYVQRRPHSWTAGLHPVNAVALGLNALFVLLHLVQTHVWYDGLAQDVSIWSSFGSVAFLLIWVLLMENPRRGLFFGKPLPLGREVVAWARKYHGYVFSWAVIYTFWYHPAEATPGHLVGFFYTLLLMLQGSLFLTRIHTHRWWTLTLEVLVLAHGTLVALMQGQAFWTMFAFGFATIFVVTQMHGLGWPRWGRLLVGVLYLGGAAWAYAGQWGRLSEVLRIPVIDYLGVVLLAGLIGGGLRIYRWWRGREGPGRTDPCEVGT